MALKLIWERDWLGALKVLKGASKEVRRTCKSCEFYQDYREGFGYCRFNAPLFKKEMRYKYYPSSGEYDKELTEDILHKEFPSTADWEWCGQHKLRLREEE